VADPGRRLAFRGAGAKSVSGAVERRDGTDLTLAVSPLGLYLDTTEAGEWLVDVDCGGGCITDDDVRW